MKSNDSEIIYELIIQEDVFRTSRFYRLPFITKTVLNHMFYALLLIKNVSLYQRIGSCYLFNRHVVNFTGRLNGK